MLIDFFKKESNAPKKTIIIMAVISGLANAFLLSVINKSVDLVTDESLSDRYFFIFIATLLIYVFTQKQSMSQGTIAAEALIRMLRIKIVNKIRQAELVFVESNGAASFYNALTRDANLVSQSIPGLVAASQSGIVVAACLLYIAWLSFSIFVMTTALLSTAVLVYFSHSKEAGKGYLAAAKKEVTFFQAINELLSGFKETKMNWQKNNALYHHIQDISKEAEVIRTKSNLIFIIDIMYAKTVFYILLTLVIFSLPLFDASHEAAIFKLTAAILFIIGPLTNVVVTVPSFATANASLINLQKLESLIDQAINQQTEHDDNNIISPPSFQDQVILSDLKFNYLDDKKNILFGIGPINLTINKGEIIFIVGGNGSGKSTLLKTATALYQKSAGSITVDGIHIDDQNIKQYHQLFSIIFTDFHLFNRLYGTSHCDDKTINDWLKIMQIDHKTQYVEGKFSNASLSTGQRKRLAFVCALLENKSIYILDEVAADQDPTFKKYFYRDLLIQLKQQGKTIIAVSHDDHYFDVADRVYEMQYGQLVEYKHSSHHHS